MRKQPIVTGEYYHIYNRGVDKRDIFMDESDLERFIESIITFNQIDTIGSLKDFKKSQPEPKALAEPLVAISVFCLNPNHFHFALKQLVDGGIAKFMQKIQAGYTYYFNVKNERSGSLFQGTFKSHHMAEEEYNMKILGYVNKNYAIHDIPASKSHLVLASDREHEEQKFEIVSKIEAHRILDIFGNTENFKKHSDEIVAILREERGKMPLSEDENLPAGA